VIEDKISAFHIPLSTVADYIGVLNVFILFAYF
jgi:hypothetical protein